LEVHSVRQNINEDLAHLLNANNQTWRRLFEGTRIPDVSLADDAVHVEIRIQVELGDPAVKVAITIEFLAVERVEVTGEILRSFTATGSAATCGRHTLIGELGGGRSGKETPEEELGCQSVLERAFHERVLGVLMGG
jgi:hypothetical protein